jgi:1-acyl-sn-glycerol-3-phosphate acyltransferase
MEAHEPTNDPGPPEPDTAVEGATVELALSDLHERLDPARSPARADELRTFLPGLEPDRRVTDWGRSERVEALVDRTVYDFLYHYWFRVEVEGVENVPSSGGALLVANHAGAIPPDGIMIGKAIREEHAYPRPLHLAVDQYFTGIPGTGALITKTGGVAAHPANVHRLLFDEGELVLMFPEGRRGPRKPLRERYRLRRFDGGGFVVAAMRARAPIVPVAVVGAEEAQPNFGRLNPLQRFTKLPSLPLTPILPLPAKFRIRFLEPVQTDELGDEPWLDQGLVHTLAQDIRALIQENVLELVAARRSVWFG